jgi:hypothetical protein
MNISGMRMCNVGLLFSLCVTFLCFGDDVVYLGTQKNDTREIVYSVDRQELMATPSWSATNELPIALTDVTKTVLEFLSVTSTNDYEIVSVDIAKVFGRNLTNKWVYTVGIYKNGDYISPDAYIMVKVLMNGTIVTGKQKESP